MSDPTGDDTAAAVGCAGIVTAIIVSTVMWWMLWEWIRWI